MVIFLREDHLMNILTLTYNNFSLDILASCVKLPKGNNTNKCKRISSAYLFLKAPYTIRVELMQDIARDATVEHYVDLNRTKVILYIRSKRELYGTIKLAMGDNRKPEL